MPPFKEIAKLGISGALLVILGWLVYTVITGFGPKIDKLSEAVDFLSDAVYSSCDAKPPPRHP